MNEECRRYQESYGDTRMPDELVRHGGSCEACREFSRRQEIVQHAMSSWKTPEFSPDFTLSVMSRLAEENTRRQTLPDFLRAMVQFRFSIPLPVGALASILFIVSLALNIAFWPEGQSHILPGKSPLAGNLMETGFTPNPVHDPTPLVIPVTRENGDGAMGGPLVIPREFLSAGAFLLVPIIEPNTVRSFNPSDTKSQPDTHRGI